MRTFPPTRLIFAGKRLEDGHTLSDYNIQKKSALHLALRLAREMEIFVINMRGITITLYVQASDTIATTKALIQEQEGVPPNQQSLWMDWRFDLEDDRTLADYNIQQGATLHLQHPRSTIQIIAKTWTGDCTILDVEASDAIEIVKAMIEVRLDIRCGWQRLIFAGKQLEDGRMLSDYNIKEGDVLMVEV